jgi:polysaccharide biosynthesis transport protein
MSQNLQILSENTAAAPPLEPVPAASHEVPVNPLLKLHQCLTGRYHWAILLGLTLGAIAGAAAHQIVKDPYKSVGAIQIQPYLTRILYESEKSAVMPMFDAYVDTQASILQSQRTLMLAMDSPEWKAAVQKSQPHDLAAFAGGLEVMHRGGSELIQVIFNDPDPQLALVAVKSVIEAYQRIAGENDAVSQTKKLQVLEERRTSLSGQIKGLNDRILAIANEFGTDDLQRIYQPKLEEYNRLQSSLAEADIFLAYVTADANAASAPAPEHVAGSTTDPATRPQPLTPELVARLGDDQMRNFLALRDQQKATLDRLKRSYGDAYPSVREAANALQVTESQIAERMRQYEVAATQPGDSAPSATTANLAPIAGMSRKQAEFRVAELKARSEKAKAELLDIGRQELQIRSLKTQIDSIQRDLDEAKARIDQLGVESAVGGRTSVLSSGDLPVRAKRRNLPATGAGACGGFFLGVGIFALLGAFDRRLKSVADTQRFVDRSNRLLGILPALPENLSDPDQAATAAYCVHHIRTLLQLGGGTAPRSVIAVTSASPGEGKTSLVLSLGHSYAATGTKTLLIDFDIIGTGLTARSNAVVRRKLRDILVRDGLITRDQLETAVSSARKTGKTLSESLLDLKLIEPADLQRAQEAKRHSSLGLLDVLDGEPLANCIGNGTTKNLSILPMGNVGTQHGGQVSLSQVQRIIREARQNFDVVLIDTGPILGSLETCVVAAVADEVILVVARGQQRPLIDKAFSRLSDVGARIAGVVFNRAGKKDVEHSAYTSYRTSHRSTLQLEVHASGGSPGKSNRLGPVAQSVVRAESIPEAPAKDPP